MENYPESKAKLNYELLNQLIIELGYFFFTCKNFSIKPLIDVSEIRVEEGLVRGLEKRFSIVVFYKLEEGCMEEMEGKSLFSGILEHLETNLSALL